MEELKVIGNKVVVYTKLVTVVGLAAVGSVSVWTFSACATALGKLTGHDDSDSYTKAAAFTFHPIKTCKELLREDEAE